jgi:hypothetical protein
MDGSVKRITPYSSNGNPSCFTGDLSLAAGITPTVVFVHGAGNCRDAQHGNLGVVFYGSEPVMWLCLPDAELPPFQAWAKDAFGVRVLEVKTVIAHVNCPPPLAAADVRNQATAEMRATLTDLGRTWLTSVLVPGATQPAAQRSVAPR